MGIHIVFEERMKRARIVLELNADRMSLDVTMDFVSTQITDGKIYYISI